MFDFHSNLSKAKLALPYLLNECLLQGLIKKTDVNNCSISPKFAATFYLC